VDVEFQVTAGDGARRHLTVTGDPGSRMTRLPQFAAWRPEALKVTCCRVRSRACAGVTSSSSACARRSRWCAGLPRSEHGGLQLQMSAARGGRPCRGRHIEPRKLRHLVPVYEEHAVDEICSTRAPQLRDYLQVRGYFDSTAQVRQEDDTRMTRAHHLPGAGRSPASRARGGHHRQPPL